MSGRPSIFTDEMAQAICDRLAAGESLRSICADDEMPGRTTVLRWMEANADFGAKCARARSWQAEAYFDRMDELCNKVESGEMDPRAASCILGSLQWRAAKLAPKKYGDKVDLTHAGPDGGPVLFGRVEHTIVDPQG